MYPKNNLFHYENGSTGVCRMMQLQRQGGSQLLLAEPVAKAARLMAMAIAAWKAMFPSKTVEQIRLEKALNKAVLAGDLHWAVLNDVKNGLPIDPALMAQITKYEDPPTR